jgi:hypothetical protein
MTGSAQSGTGTSRTAAPGFRFAPSGLRIQFSNSRAVIASEAKQSSFREATTKKESWIASSQVLPCANASRLSQAMTSRNEFALAALSARGLLEISALSNQRAQGMPGAGAPAAARVVVVSTRVSHHEYAGITRHSPRNGFNGFLRALPGDRACLPPSLTFRFRQLDTSVGASGPHDFAVRFSLARQARIRVHRIPPRVCDVASRPSEVGQDGGGYRSESGQSPRGIFS